MSYNKVYGPQDFGKPPLLLGFCRSFYLDAKEETEIPIGKIIDDAGSGTPTHWRTKGKFLRLYSQDKIPLNTRIDRRNMKEIPVDLLKLIREENYSILIGKGAIVEERTLKSGKKTIMRPSYCFDYDVGITSDTYWFA